MDLRSGIMIRKEYMEIDPKDKERHKNLVQCLNFLKDEIKEIEDRLISRALMQNVDELELSVRIINCFKSENIIFLGDLVQKTEGEMLRTPNFGRKSLNEIKEVLSGMSLDLGMEILWPPQAADWAKGEFNGTKI